MISRSGIVALTLYFVVMAGIVFGMYRARDWAEEAFSQTAAQTEWNEFRGDVAEANETSPVQRRVPKSDQPPALVLMRDYFGVCLAISLVLTTAMYATLTFFTLGVLRQGKSAT